MALGLEFVVKENIELFVGRIATECNPERRMLIKELLLQELERLIEPDAQLRVISDAIQYAEKLLIRQSGVAERLDADGRDARIARDTLANTKDVLALLKEVLNNAPKDSSK